MSDDPKWDDATALPELIKIAQKREELFERLAEVGRAFDRAKTPSEKRRTALVFMQAIVEYLRAEDTPRDHMTIIQVLKVPQALVGDILNIENGHEISFLEPERSDDRKRPAKSIIEDTGLAAASALIDHLIKKGWPRPDAAQRVAREMEKRGLALPSPKSKSDPGPAKRLLDFRKRLRIGERPKAVDAAYNEMAKIIAPMEAEAAIRFTIDSL